MNLVETVLLNKTNLLSQRSLGFPKILLMNKFTGY
jgi:hypothetical protein